MLGILAIVALLLAWGLSVLSGKAINPYSLNFGSLDPNALVMPGNGASIAGMSIMANAPQLIVATLGLCYNNILTSMFLATDYARFAHEPQPLLVSSPAGKQRGSWLLGLPWPFALLSLGLQTVVQWLVSQALFTAQIVIYDADGNLKFDAQDGLLSQRANCGYSPWAIWASLASGVVLLLTAYTAGMLRFRKGSPPIVSTCSAAISAACHVPALPGHGEKWEEAENKRKQEMSFGSFRWGAVVRDNAMVGHCSVVPAEDWDDGKVGVPRYGAPYN